jgi:hypothetical protein
VNPNGLDLVTAVHVADALAHEAAPSLATERDVPPPVMDVELLERLGLAGRLPEWRACAEELAEVMTTERVGDG